MCIRDRSDTHAPGKNTCSLSRKTDNLLRVDVSLHGSDDCLHRGAYRQRLPRNRMAGFYFRLGGVIRSGRIFLPFHLPDGIGRCLLYTSNYYNNIVILRGTSKFFAAPGPVSYTHLNSPILLSKSGSFFFLFQKNIVSRFLYILQFFR